MKSFATIVTALLTVCVSLGSADAAPRGGRAALPKRATLQSKKGQGGKTVNSKLLRVPAPKKRRNRPGIGERIITGASVPLVRKHAQDAVSKRRLQDRKGKVLSDRHVRTTSFGGHNLHSAPGTAQGNPSVSKDLDCLDGGAEGVPPPGLSEWIDKILGTLTGGDPCDAYNDLVDKLEGAGYGTFDDNCATVADDSDASSGKSFKRSGKSFSPFPGSNNRFPVGDPQPLE